MLSYLYPTIYATIFSDTGESGTFGGLPMNSFEQAVLGTNTEEFFDITFEELATMIREAHKNIALDEVA